MNTIYSITNKMDDYNRNKAFISAELSGLYGREVLEDMKDIIKQYEVYETGAEFDVEGGGNGDYIPADHTFKLIKKLIDKEARFLFAIPPSITLTDASDSEDKDRVNPNQILVKEVLKANRFNSKLIRAAKDCLIGKRLAITINFNDKGIAIDFLPSLEFVYDTDPENINVITKLIQFYNTEVDDNKNSQRVYKKKWEMRDGFCIVSEGYYDGNGKLVNEILPETKTEFSYIPAYVIVNGGLVNDTLGTSDVEELMDDESWYNKLSSKDFDSLRKGTDQIVYTMDVNPKSTENLSRRAGSFWDLSTSPTAGDSRTGQVGCLDNSMAYSPALDSTLNRIKTNMFGQFDIPDTSNEALQGIITSGKTMEAIYWGLSTRCDEKMLDWTPALEFVVNTIIEGSMLYSDAKAKYTDEELVADYNVEIENNYPIMKDTNEEKAADIIEINAKVKSRKSYLKKWTDMTDEEVDDELKQIQLEQSMFEDQNMFNEPLMMGDKKEPEDPEEPEEE